MRLFLSLFGMRVLVIGLSLFIAGWKGRAQTVYSPPGRAFLTNAPAVRLILPAEGAVFPAHTSIRLQALATPHGTHLEPEQKGAGELIASHPNDWESVQSPEDTYTVEFFAGTNRLGSQVAGEVSARARQRRGYATPMVMLLLGYPAVEVTWSNVPAGTYVLTAKVTNQNGLATVSAPVKITVN